MQVNVKDLAVTMALGNNGIELEIRDNDGTHLGDLCIGRGTVEWCQGRTHRGNGVRKTWNQVIDWFNE